MARYGKRGCHSCDWGCREARVSLDPSACASKVPLAAVVQKAKTLRAPLRPRKVLVIELISAPPGVPGARAGHRVDGLARPARAGDLLPFRSHPFYSQLRGDFNRTDPRVVDRILHHRDSSRCKAGDPFAPRAPPIARPGTPA